MTALQGDGWPPEPITTERLVVRTPRESDRDAFVGLLSSSQARRYLGGPLTPEDAAAAVTGPYGRHPGSFVAALADSGACVGTVGLDRRDPDRPGHLHPGGLELEISYVFDTAHWGRGYASEAVTAVLGWASTVLPDREVVACTQVANTTSSDLLQRLGFNEREHFTEFDALQSLWSRELAA